MKTALVLFLALTLRAQDFSKLPEWARPHAEAAAKESVPAEADAWVLLDRTEIAYAGEGEIRTRRLRLVKVLGERGLGHRTFLLHGLGGRASKVKKLKGWNLRPDGELEQLDQDTIVTMDTDDSGSISTSVATSASLQRVVKGSLVAWESLQALNYPTGPSDLTGILEASPIRRWELETAKQEGWFTHLKQVEVHLDLVHFAPWIPKPEVVVGQRVAASNLPALPQGERLHPDGRDMLPWVSVRFIDPELKGYPGLKSWNALAAWTFAHYVRGPLGALPVDSLAALKASHRFLCTELSYRQVYLRPERGWVPERPEEVLRKRYGDCKDLAGWLIQEARKQGLEAFPALSRINVGEIFEDEPPTLDAFNHVIAAIQLTRSLGLPGEVEAGGRRFLLVDATDRYTPLGQLYVGHQGRRVMIALGTEALWVRVPDAAILRPRVEIHLEGRINEKGVLEGQLTFRETGNALGLRGRLHQSGPAGLREHLLTEVMDLPPLASLILEGQGDPLAGDQPLKVVLKITYPEGFRLNAGEWSLQPMGLFPQPGTPLVKAGKPRAYPIESRNETIQDFTANLLLPFPVQPVLGLMAFETPFRKVDYRAGVVTGRAASTLELRFLHARRPVRFGMEEVEKGMGEWKMDRALVRTLATDGLAFKRLP
jgi:hypothetical protein